MSRRKVIFIHLTLAGIALRRWRIPTSEEDTQIETLIDIDSQVVAAANTLCLERLLGDTEANETRVREEIKRYVREESREPHHVFVFVLCDQIIAVLGYWTGSPILYESTVQRDFLAIHPGTNRHIKAYVEEITTQILKDARSEE